MVKPERLPDTMVMEQPPPKKRPVLVEKSVSPEPAATADKEPSKDDEKPKADPPLESVKDDKKKPQSPEGSPSTIEDAKADEKADGKADGKAEKQPSSPPKPAPPPREKSVSSPEPPEPEEKPVEEDRDPLDDGTNKANKAASDKEEPRDKKPRRKEEASEDEDDEPSEEDDDDDDSMEDDERPVETGVVSDERLDLTEDRIYEDDNKLIGKKLKGLYDDGWHTGVIDYFNLKLQQYHVDYGDALDDDYITKDDIDGVELVLVESSKELDSVGRKELDSVESKELDDSTSS